MTKPHKKRYCRRLDKHRFYMPADASSEDLQEVVLNLDEFESMRLCDYEGMSQIQASDEMHVSRGTIQRLLLSARHKIVEALLEGKSIVVSNEIANIQLKGENNMDKRSKDVIRIAMPTTDGVHVDEHFGHCKSFVLYDVQDNRVVEQTTITPPPHAPGVLPRFLGEQNTDVIITGGMGQMAIRLFKEQDIDVILGAQGKLEDNLREFIGGDLVSDGTPCEHNHG